MLKTLEEIKRQAPRPKDEEKTKKKKPEPKALPFEDQIAQALALPSRKHNPSRPLAISEIDLVRSGLDDTMRLAFQQIRDRYWENKNIENYRIAAMAIAIEKIHHSYKIMGIYP